MIRALGRIRRIRPTYAKFARHLVGDPSLAVDQQSAGLPDSPGPVAASRRRRVPNVRRKRNRLAGRIGHRVDNAIQILQFAGGVDLRVAGQNLLNERAAGTGHADDENWNGRGIAHPSQAIQQACVEPSAMAWKVR